MSSARKTTEQAFPEWYKLDEEADHAIYHSDLFHRQAHIRSQTPRRALTVIRCSDIRSRFRSYMMLTHQRRMSCTINRLSYPVQKVHS